MWITKKDCFITITDEVILLKTQPWANFQRYEKGPEIMKNTNIIDN